VSSIPGDGCADIQQHLELVLRGLTSLARLGDKEREPLQERIRRRHETRIDVCRGSTLQALPQVILHAPRAFDMHVLLDVMFGSHDSMMVSQSFTDKRTEGNRPLRRGDVGRQNPRWRPRLPWGRSHRHRGEDSAVPENLL